MTRDQVLPQARPPRARQLAAGLVRRVRRVGSRVRLRVLLGATTARTPLHRRVAAACWRRPHLLREVVRTADPAALRSLLALAPASRRDDADVRLVAALVSAGAGDEVDREDLEAAARHAGDDDLRRLVASRLLDLGEAGPAWTVAESPPRVELSATRLARLARSLEDVDALEVLIRRTSERLAGPTRDRRTVRLHREALLSRGRIPYHDWHGLEALHWFDRAHDEAGPTVRTWTWRAKALRRLGRLDESRISGEAALAEAPEWVPLLVHMGKLYRELGDRPASTDCWRRILALKDVSVDHLRRTWAGLMRVREFEVALAAAQRLVDATGGDPEARAMKAATLLELGQLDEAGQVVADLEGRTDAASIRGRARYLGRTGKAAEAYELLQQLPAARWGAVAAEELYHMLRRDGHLDLAREEMEVASAAMPRVGGLRQLRDEAISEERVFTADWRALARPPATIEPVPGRVLHVVGRAVPYASSGYTVRTDYTVRAQQALGTDVHVVTQLGFPWDEGREAPLDETVGGVPHYHLPLPPDVEPPLVLEERLDRHIDALGDLVERLRPAVLHAASDFRNAIPALAVGEQFDLPVVYEMRGFWEDTWLAKREDAAAERPMYRLRRERETEAATRATHVTTLAPTMREDLIARGIDPGKISVVPNAVDATSFLGAARDDGLAQSLGIGPNEVVAGYVSSFSGYEGIHVLIDAVARLRAQGEAIRCLLVGDGEFRPILEHQVRRLGVDDAVVFTGRVPHNTIEAYYGLIDVFVVPRTNARVCRLVSPLKPYEAMAAGRAIVLSGTPVLRSLIEEGVTGVTFEPEDADDLARRIRELAADPGLRGRLGAAARQFVLDQHTWERNAERYLEVYRRVGVAAVASEPTG